MGRLVDRAAILYGAVVLRTSTCRAVAARGSRVDRTWSRAPCGCKRLMGDDVEVVPTVSRPLKVTALRHCVESSAFSADPDNYPSAHSIPILIRNPLNLRAVHNGTSTS